MRRWDLVDWDHELPTNRWPVADPETSLRVDTPSSGPVCIQLSGVEDGAISVSIFDIAGRLVAKREASVLGGSSSFEFSIDGVSSGLYFAVVEGGDQTLSSKFVLIR